MTYSRGVSPIGNLNPRLVRMPVDVMLSPTQSEPSAMAVLVRGGERRRQHGILIRTREELEDLATSVRIALGEWGLITGDVLNDGADEPPSTFTLHGRSGGEWSATGGRWSRSMPDHRAVAWPAIDDYPMEVVDRGPSA